MRSRLIVSAGFVLAAVLGSFGASQASEPGSRQAEDGLIAFASERDGDEDVYVMDAHGHHETNITNSWSEDAFPDWSPDGSLIAFSSGRNADGADIYLMDAQGGHLVQVTPGGTSDTMPSWSPDGKWIAFARYGLGGG